MTVWMRSYHSTVEHDEYERVRSDGRELRFRQRIFTSGCNNEDFRIHDYFT